MSSVAVVMPAFQAARWIDASLESLQSQTFRDWVCVVVDDGSTDGTAAVVRRRSQSDPRIRLVCQPNRGVGAARNAGLSELAELGAAPDYLSFLDSDDTLLPDALGLLVARLDARPDAVGAYGLAEYCDEAGEPLAPGAHPRRQQDRRVLQGRRLVDVAQGADVTFEELVANSPVWPSSVALCRRSVVEQVGGYDASFAAQGDWELYLRASRLGPFLLVDRQVAWYRRHAGNITGRGQHVQFQQARLRRVAWTSAANTPAQRRSVARAWRYLTLRRAWIAARSARTAVLARRPGPAGAYTVAALVNLLELTSPGPPAAHHRLVSLDTPFPAGLLDGPEHPRRGRRSGLPAGRSS